jgi:hypothetical protein
MTRKNALVADRSAGDDVLALAFIENAVGSDYFKIKWGH